MSAETPLPRRAHWLIRYEPDVGDYYEETCHCPIGEDHDAGSDDD